jgi:Rrf2 family protein
MTLSDSGSWARCNDVVAMAPTLPPAHFCPGPGRGQTLAMHIPAKVDYGIRALLALAAAGTPQTAEFLAGEQGLPPRFLGAILADLRRAGVVASQRGAEGGYRLARDPGAITIADVIRALDGPLAEVRGFRPEATNYNGAAENLQQVWVAVRASLRAVLEKVTLTDVITGELPTSVQKLVTDPDAWVAH